MSCETSLESPKNMTSPVCIAMGFFDGVHLGHVRVLQSAMTQAARLGGTAWMVSFDPHPNVVLRPDVAPEMLMTIAQKCDHARLAGIDGCLTLPFSKKIAQQTPEDFVAQLCEQMPTLQHIAVGAQWRFGHRRSGTLQTLADLGRQHGFSVEGVEAVSHGDAPISSTRIRAAVAQGQLEEAEAMLGRPFSVRGRVVEGQRLGRTLGYPTANLDLADGVRPPQGVYAARATVAGKLHDGVVSYGRRPTVADANADPVMELHLFDYEGDLYGLEIELYFEKFIRPEQKFDSLERLRTRIAADCEEAQRVLIKQKVKDKLYIRL
ncbi:MAG: bifunctional riboflavin kinase/FAD synthetase [Kiritimatiellae bacterium]|nr:bifunctional riboflavin kinase/FAD synthetase [Kiritimatiellia bacterium]